jgi:CRP/FNR family cyclic AMP-dependent transcriptional regulator
MSEHNFRTGETLFRKGDPSELAYVVESGEVEVLEEQPGGETRIAVLGKGNILGEMGLVEERPHSMTARALSDVRASSVTREGFVELILQHPQESLRYLRALFERLRTMNSRAAAERLVAGNHAAQGEDHAVTNFEVTLVPLTKQAGEALPAAAATGLRLPCSPFRVGRAPSAGETSLDSNDLALPDVQPYNISRNHFSVAIHGDGVFVHDRGSYLGTVVNGTRIGGRHRTASALLLTGDNEVIAGARRSPFRFRVVVRVAQ